MSLPHLTNPDVVPDAPLTPQEAAQQATRRRLFRRVAIIVTTLAILFAIIGFVITRHWLRQAMQDSLPQLDGAVSIPGLSAPVTIQRDAHGVPHLRAATLDDLLLAQGFVTAQDRLWQMDSLRRHASGTLAEILGPNFVAHDRLQRTLLIRASADRAIANLPPDQLHLLERYAAGVNASIDIQRAHLPLEFRLLRYQPAPWTPRDSLLVALVMFQDLTTSFPSELSREALTARLPQSLVADLYPVVTWRDHPPAQPTVDLTAPQKDIPNVPLDESQTNLTIPNKKPSTPKSGARHRKPDPTPNDPDDDSNYSPTWKRASGTPSSPRTSPDTASNPSNPANPGAHSNPGAPYLDSEMWASRASATALPSSRQPSPAGNTTTSPQDLQALQQTLRNPICEDCFAGSNNWVVSGAHTATGKPLLSNDMHLAHTVPGIWYEADLQVGVPGDLARKGGESPTSTANLHVTGVSLPGVPFIIVGHNDNVAWGFTNLGATVQDVYIEHTRGAGPTAQYESQNGSWQPFLHDHEIIHIKGGKDVALDIAATRHGTAITPVLSGVLPTEKRTLSLRWIIYDPAAITPASFLAVNTAPDAATLVSAFSTFGGPAQNLVYADDQGHIGYHAIGRIPVRGSIATPSPISPVPTDALDSSQEWIGAIPYDKLPQAVDPPGGILASANARVTPDDYPFPITLNWGSPYRNQRIWKVLTDKSQSQNKITAADMLALLTDVYSDLDHVIAQRLAYAIDHSTQPELARNTSEARRLHQAADLLRDWNGAVDANAAAPAIVVATRAALWPLLINPQAEPQPNPTAQTESAKTQPLPAAALYTWGNKAYAEEWLIMHTPARWLPKNIATWDDLLTIAVAQGLATAHAPADLSQWRYGQFRPIEIDHAIYSRSPLLERLIGVPIGTGIQPQSGDDVTVKQVGRTFGPSERFTADLADLDHTTLNLVLGQSANPLSPWFMDQWPAWYHGTTFPLPYSNAAVNAATTHTLTLTPQ